MSEEQTPITDERLAFERCLELDPEARSRF